MHFSFSAVNENADENETPFSTEHEKSRKMTKLPIFGFENENEFQSASSLMV